jgi:membrane protease YdiL (CAAX protease family)
MAMSDRRRRFLFLAVLTEGGAIILAIVLSYFLGPSLPALIRWDPNHLLLGLLMCLPLLALFALCLRVDLAPFRHIEQFFETRFMPLMQDSTKADLLLVCILAGVGEELLFRGAIQEMLHLKLGGGFFAAAFGLVVASAIFAIMHPVSKAYVIGVFIVGIYLGISVILCESLVPAMIAHGVYDFIALLYLQRKYRRPGTSD